MKSKKLLLGSLSAMALVATPIATVVSCNGKDSDTTATKASIVKATAEDYKLTYKTFNIFVSKADAAKAGSFDAGAETITWDKKLSDSSVKFKNGEDDATVTHVKATAGDFGLKLASGLNMYLDASGLKNTLTGFFNLETTFKTAIGIELKFNDKKKITTDSLAELNKFLKPASLEITTVTTDDAGIMTPDWKAPASTGGGSGTNTGGNGQTGSTQVADDADIKTVKNALETITFSNPNGDGIKAKTGATLGAVTTLDEIKALVAKTDGTTAAVLTKTAGNFPTLNGVTLTVKSIATATTGTSNIVVSVAKGQGTTVDATIVITLL